MISVYLALHDNKVLSVTTESVELALEMGQNIICYVLASLAVWLCKHGAGEAAADRSQGSHSVFSKASTTPSHH